MIRWILLFFVYVLIGCQVDTDVNDNDLKNRDNLLANLIVFQTSADFSFSPSSGTVHPSLNKITLNMKSEFGELTKEDLILFSNNVSKDFELVKISNKQYEIKFEANEGKINLELSKVYRKFNLTSSLIAPFWIMDQQIPVLQNENKTQNIHQIDLAEGNILIPFSEAVEGGDELKNYQFILSDPNEMQILKILKIDEQNFRLFVQSYTTKPLSIKIIPKTVKDYAGNLVENEEINVNVFGFRRIGNMREKRCDFSAIAIDNENILISGGVNSGTISNTVEIFNIKTESFRLLSSTLSKPIFYHKSFRLNDGKVIFFGGYENFHIPSGNTKFGIVNSNSYIYNPLTDTVSAGPSLNTPRTNFSSVQRADGSIIVTGGMTVVSSVTADLRYSNVIETYSPALNTFTTSTLTLPTTLHSHSSALLGDGKILVFGGLIDRLDTSTAYNYSLLRLDLDAVTSTSLKTLQNNYIESFFDISGNRLVLGSGLRSSNVQIFNTNTNAVSTVGGLEKSLGQTTFSKDSRYNNILSGISGNTSSSPLSNVIHFANDFSRIKTGMEIPEPKFCNATVSLGNKHYIFGGATNFSGYIKVAGGLNLSNASSDTVWVYETK